MSPAPHPASIPRPVLIGAGLLLGCTIALAAAAHMTGFGRVGLPQAAPLASVELRFEDRADGAVTVYGNDDELVAVLPPESNGFIRGVMRGLARERKLANIGRDVPFRLTRWDDGRLSLRDEATGDEVELTAFGHTNAGAFASLLQQSDRTTQVVR